ncbi:hypothetical protein EH802P2_00110 [Enterococcus phage EH802P2]|nr:hypothetical protein EH802P1_00106 [Enterococcus phage EH802P1]WAX16215.1 hypothetical protein EH802P2_00110 [Enterococcus phage EH802P2]
MLMLATGIFMGFFPSVIFIMWTVWSEDARWDKYTQELKEEKQKFKQNAINAASQYHECKERCSKLEIEYDVLKVKYERLLKEGI